MDWMIDAFWAYVGYSIAQLFVALTAIVAFFVIGFGVALYRQRQLRKEYEKDGN